MLTVQGKLPREVTVAVSGGADSLAALDFLKNNHKVTAVFFDHQTEASRHGWYVTQSYCGWRDIKLIRGNIESRSKPSDQSWEQYWRECRYEFFDSLPANQPVITCHHLDDCVETWIWSALNGTANVIPYRRKNVIRPFRLNRKTQFYNWARNRQLTWYEDPSNEDIKYIRNYIRHQLVPNALVVNPGLFKVIAKKIAEQPFDPWVDDQQK